MSQMSTIYYLIYDLGTAVSFQEISCQIAVIKKIVKIIIFISNSISVRMIMLPLCQSSPAQLGTHPILCCFKFNQDIIYLGYDVSRVVVHWSKPEPVRLLQILQMFPVAITQEHSTYLWPDDSNNHKVAKNSMPYLVNWSEMNQPISTNVRFSWNQNVCYKGNTYRRRSVYIQPI